MIVTLPTDGTDEQVMRANAWMVKQVLAALGGPRRLAVVGGRSAAGEAVAGRELGDAFAFTRAVYKLLGKEEACRVAAEEKPADLAAWL